MKTLETIKSTELLNLITVTRIGDILNTKAKFAKIIIQFQKTAKYKLLAGD